MTTSATVTLVMATLGGLIMVRDSGYEVDDIIMSWVLTILLMLFMFCAGLSVVSFPWVFMGTILHPRLFTTLNLITCQPNGSALILSRWSPRAPSPAVSS